MSENDLEFLGRHDLEALAASFAPESFRYFQEVGSTNDVALQALGVGIPALPALIVAGSQTAGRGQQARTWFSAPGNLMASWIVAGPDSLAAMKANWTRQLAIAVPLMICESIQSVCGADTRSLAIKWPNDVFLDGKKCAGILIEATSASGQAVAVIGIGLNVNGEFPEPTGDWQPLLSHATSLKRFLGHAVSLGQLFTDLNQRILEMSRRLSEGSDGSDEFPGSSTRVDQYNQRLVYRNQAVEVVTPGGELTGYCRGISEQGTLLLETKAGMVEISSGSIRGLARQ